MSRRNLILVGCLYLASCAGEPPEMGRLPLQGDTTEVQAQAYYRNGRKVGTPQLEQLYTRQPLDSLGFSDIDNGFFAALATNERLLKQRGRRKHYQLGNLSIAPDDLARTVDILQILEHGYPEVVANQLEAHQIWGADRRGHVRFTGYFTPVIAVSRKREGAYQYPIYSRPLGWAGPLPSRADIDGQRLFDGKGLELAYAKSKVDIYYMQLQGSGYVEYSDGSRELFAYNGNNRYPYRSIEKYIASRPELGLTNLSIASIKAFLDARPALADTVLFQNPSYTFFVRQNRLPTGAGGVPLVADYSIAVDKRYIPLGATLLAAFPVFDQRTQRVIRHDYRLVVAQDVGGAIKGPGHVDFYTGVGSGAEREAGNTNAYGQLWLLLPKKTVASKDLVGPRGEGW